MLKLEHVGNPELVKEVERMIGKTLPTKNVLTKDAELVIVRLVLKNLITENLKDIAKLNDLLAKIEFHLPVER